MSVRVKEKHFGQHALSLTLMVVVPAIFVLALIFGYAGDDILEPKTRRVFFPLFVGSEIMFLGAWLFQYFGFWRFARAVTVWTVSLIIVGAITSTGGLERSVAAPTILLPPLFVFCLYDGRKSMPMAVAVIAPMILSEIARHLFSLEIADYTSTNNAEANTLIVIGTCFVVMFGVLGALSKTNLKLRNQLREERDRIEALANQDMLTSLSNRRGFYASFSSICANQSGKASFVLLYLDLDKFKPINDQHGHEAGDFALKTIADRLMVTLPNANCIARLGGDEFAIIHPQTSHPRFMKTLCSELNEAIGAPMTFKEKIFRVGTSIGSATIPSENANPDIVLATADRRMIENKISNHVRIRTGARSQSSLPNGQAAMNNRN